jgi:phage-related protein (TIGR01555 family)
MSIQEFNTDSSALLQFFAGAGRNSLSPFQNPLTGQGTAKDKSTAFEIHPPKRMPPQERVWLYRSSKLIQRAVSCYPKAATAKWCEFEVGSAKRIKPDAINNYLQNLPRGSLQSAFTLAGIEANWHGDSFILLGIDDERNWDEPVDELNIKSLRWAEVLYYNEVQLKTSAGFRNPEFYQIKLQHPIDEGEERLRTITVHKSRILHFYGVLLTGDAFQQNNYQNDSVIQAALYEFGRMNQALSSSSSMLADYSLFIYKLNGLRKIGQKTNPNDKGTLDLEMLMLRFAAMQMGMSSINGLAVDAETEDASFINRSFSGVDPILNILIDAFVSATDLPRSKLLGTSARAGLGNEGRGEQERYEWASLVEDWQNEHFRDQLLYCQRICLLAKDSPSKGKLPDGYGLTFNSILQLTQKEVAEIKKIESETDNIDIGNGVIKPIEARLARHAGNSSINLDPNITAEMMAENVKPEPVPEVSNSDALYGVWFGGRRTPIVVNATSREEAIKKARPKKRRGGDSVDAARLLNESERKTVSSGNWVRTGTKGEKAGYKGKRGYGLPTKDAADDEFLTEEEWEGLTQISAADWLETVEDVVDG